MIIIILLCLVNYLLYTIASNQRQLAINQIKMFEELNNK